MEIAELQSVIREGKPKGCYILTGPEGAVQRVYLNMMAEKAGLAVVRLDSASDAIRAMTQHTLSPEKRLYVVFDDVAFTKAEKAWNTVFSRAEATQHVLLLQYSKLDGRLKFSKRNKDRICVFDTLGPDIAAKYVQKEIPNLHPDVAEMLAEACGYDYSRILTETDKVRQYFNARSRFEQEQRSREDAWTIDDAALELIHDGVIYRPIGDITFSLTDAIMYRAPGETMQYLAQALAKGEPELVVLTVLYNNFRALLLVQGLGADRRDAAKRTGLTPFQVKLASEKIGHYKLAEIQSNLRMLQEIEYGIKTGTFDAAVALAYAATACLAAA